MPSVLYPFLYKKIIKPWVALRGCPLQTLLTALSASLFSSSDRVSPKQPKSLAAPTQPPARGFSGRGATTPEPPTTPSSGPG